MTKVRARLIVTLPPRGIEPDPLTFARRARAAGADLLELRSDLHTDADVEALSRELPLLVSERGTALPPSWLTLATEVDRPPRAIGTASIRSHHADEPMTSETALALWGSTPVGEVQIKHIEPLGNPADAARLFETQARLAERFGAARVTVLAVGPLALPFRSVLAVKNALDFVALDERWAAAPGQRLLRDAARERRVEKRGPRRGILGARISGSRSPRVHRQPFDRIDLPEDTDLRPLLEALHPWYEGFAVTTPFKQMAAALASARPDDALPAANTLIRDADGWRAANTDVDGALSALEWLDAGPLTALGDGGATAALRIVCRRLGRSLRVLKRSDSFSEPVTGLVVWTWPSHLAPPRALRFSAARVGILAYGAAGRSVAAVIRDKGGVPVPLGLKWFLAQARGQRRLWEGAVG
jgi:hypothetical protein